MPSSEYEASSDVCLSNATNAYGCIFCTTGKELLVANAFEQKNEGVKAIAVRQMKRRSVCGTTVLQDEIILPGYLFFQICEPYPQFPKVPGEKVLSVLTYTDGDWKMYGDDAEFAQWLFKHGGRIGLSQASYRPGERVKILSGPLKDYEGYITRIDRRNKNGQVSIPFGGRVVKVWLGFDIVEEQKSSEDSSLFQRD